ncbi:ParB/RepB/Spo0J family partition protein [Rhodococcus sp. CH91]|uniref:ParB/RepB/Spo0J family partition protein n=1 Tax=Rhodococcus sp. CH91 TaxID=2910256 RepID=UPI001F4B9507|nr:ParB/RepB/Spo0J family partition protein [Rhodococcus sp. CH91]
MSATRKGGLGRGLAALIPTGPPVGAEKKPMAASSPADPPEKPASSADPVSSAPAQAAASASAQPVAPAPTKPAASRRGGSPALNLPSSGLGSAAADVIIGDGKPAVKEPASDTAQSAGASTVGDPLPSPTGAVYLEIPTDRIEPNPKQPRQVFDEEALAELVHSIREFGLMQPVVVRRLEGGDRFQLIMGERRWRAVQEAGLETIPAIVRDTEDQALLRDALLENIHRVQLNPLEEAAAYQQLLEEFEVTHEELASRLGRSRPVITNMIRLLKLPVAVQRRVAAGVLSAGHARALLALEAGADAQEALAARIVAEGLSVRATEEAVVLANRSDTPDAPQQKRRKPIRMPGLEDVAERLSNSFDTRVTVSLGKRKGKIVVEFGSVDDLERIVKMMESQTEIS